MTTLSESNLFAGLVHHWMKDYALTDRVRQIAYECRYGIVDETVTEEDMNRVRKVYGKGRV